MSVKVKQCSKNIQDPEIVDMFQQLINPEACDPEIVFPKYKKIKSLTQQSHRFIKAFYDEMSVALKGYDFEAFKAVSAKMKEDLVKYDLTIDNVVANYKDFKNTYAVQECIMICSYLSNYKAHLSVDLDKLNDGFIKHMTLGIALFPFSSFDLVLLWDTAGITPDMKKYILMFLSMLYKNTYEIYKIFISPDIDIKKFSKLLIDSIAKLQKQPELSRCGRAFGKIKNSLSLLENNFEGYYKDFIQSKNPSSIIESFVIDVAKDTDADLQTTREFRKIIQFYHKVSQNNKIKDPKLQKLFKNLNDNMNILEGKAKARNNIVDNTDSVDNTDNVNNIDDEIDELNVDMSACEVSENNNSHIEEYEEIMKSVE